MSHVLTPKQIAQYAYDAGFRGQALTTAVAVALAESSGNPHSHNAVPPDDSYGLWQINMLGALGPDRRADFHLKSDAELFDPAVNARAAYSISSHGTSFGPWTTYTSGAYRDHLGAARKAAQAVTADGGHDHGHGHGHGKKSSSGRVVLDLAELARLSHLFEDSANRVEHTRLALRRLATDVEPARLKLRDQALATLISNVLTAADAPTQLARAASRLQQQGVYAEKVRRLAEQADGGDGKWSRADARKFVKSIGPTTDPYERAVKEALLGGVIVRGGKLTGRKAPSTSGGKLPPQGVAGLTNGKVPPSKLSSVGDGEKMTKAAASEFRKMDAAAHSAGLDLHVNSGYRTYSEQAALYQQYLNGTGNLAAPPGTSDHGLGLSADINVTDPHVLAWLREHAHTYGFVNDVPSESWHWTYKP